MIRLTIDMPRWVWWLALRFRLAIALEVEGELLAPLDLVRHGRPLTLIYRGRGPGGVIGEVQLNGDRDKVWEAAGQQGEGEARMTHV